MYSQWTGQWTDQWIGFYMIETSVMKELIHVETETLTKLVPLELNKNIEVFKICSLITNHFLTI